MALDQRAAPFNLHITSLWADPADDEANIAWTRALSAAIKPFATGRVYVNFIGDEGEERVVASFGARGLRAPAGDQGPLRPGQPVPQQPEHQAERRLS